MHPQDISLRLLRHGLIVFLLGLCSGLAMIAAAHVFTNLRLAMSSHVIGVTSGMFLGIVGLMLDRVHLPARALTVTYWLALYGAYGNWLGTLLGAIYGTQTLTAVTGQGTSGAPWQEALVGVVLTTSGAGTMVACVLLLIGLRPNRSAPP